ncbi:MAG: ComEC family competence protein [Rhodococcus sp.]|nr:ComEC family competence protein [Rhodococcus sp. (in: high G+C Gram-positive bacteria)]
MTDMDSRGVTGEIGRALDARLVPFALICWGAMLLGITAGSRAASIGGVAMLALFAVLLAFWLRTRSVGAFAGASVLLFGTLACCGIGWQVAAVESHPLGDLAADRASAAVQASIAEDPVALRSAGTGGWQQVRVRVRVEEVRIGNRDLGVGGAVTVFAPAEVWSELLPGQQVRFRAKFETPRRHDLTVAVAYTDGAPQEIGPASWYQQWAATVRGRFAHAAERALPPDQAGLLPGLVVGDTSDLDDEVKDAFRAAGLTHLTAVSGANVSIVLGAVLLVVTAIGVGPRTAAVLAALALVAFVVIVRPSPSVLRAAAMGSVTILAMVTGRRRQALPALSGSVVLLLLVHPELAVNFGFALSVVATLALIVIAPVWSDRLRARGWPRSVAEIVAVATAAFVVTTPLVAAMAGTVSVVSIAANILVAPVVAIITVCGGFTALLAVVSIPVAEWGARSVTLPLWWLLTVADTTSGWPGAGVVVPSGIHGAVLTVGILTSAGVTVMLAVRWMNPALRRTRRCGVAPSFRAQFRSGRSASSRAR